MRILQQPAILSMPGRCKFPVESTVVQLTRHLRADGVHARLRHVARIPLAGRVDFTVFNDSDAALPVRDQET